MDSGRGIQAIILSLLAAILTIAPVTAALASKSADTLGVASGTAERREWGFLYLSDGSGGLSVSPRDAFFAGKFVGLNASVGELFGLELALGGLVYPGDEGRARYSLLPVYAHMCPFVRWHEPAYGDPASHPRLMLDFYLGGCAWAKGFSDPDGRSIFWEDGYLHGGARLLHIDRDASGSVGIDLGAVLVRSVKDEGSAELSWYAALSLGLGLWL